MCLSLTSQLCTLGYTRNLEKTALSRCEANSHIISWYAATLAEPSIRELLFAWESCKADYCSPSEPALAYPDPACYVSTTALSAHNKVAESQSYNAKAKNDAYVGVMQGNPHRVILRRKMISLSSLFSLTLRSNHDLTLFRSYAPDDVPTCLGPQDKPPPRS
nr:hypothetical protein CFP56_24535 [Quercus suber]